MVPTLKRPTPALFIALLAPFVRPVGLDYFPVIGKLMTLYRLIATLYLMISLVPLLIRPAFRLRRTGLLALCVYWIVYLFGCIRVGTGVVSIASSAISSLLLVLLVNYEMHTGNGMILLKGLSRLFIFYIIMHIASVFLVKADLLWMGFVGESPVYLFGMDNYSAFYIYPMLAIILYYWQLRDGSFGVTGWLLLFAVIGVYLLTKSVTAAGAGVLMVPFLFCKKQWSKLPQILGIRLIIVAMALLLVGICVFQIQNYLAVLLDSMSKGVTLNSRTYIWDHALKLIRQRPWFGHGTFTQTQLYEEYILYGTSHAHNILLDLLLCTGIVGAAAYLYYLFSFSPILSKKPLPKAHSILLITLLGQMVLCFMDFYPTILVFYLFMQILICSHCMTEQENAVALRQDTQAESKEESP